MGFEKTAEHMDGLAEELGAEAKRGPRHRLSPEAVQDALAKNGLTVRAERYDPGGGREAFSVEWRDGDELAGRLDFYLDGDEVVWTNLWLEEGHRRQGLYRQVVAGLHGPLSKRGVWVWKIAEVDGMSDDARGVYLRSGFEPDGDWLVADRRDPDHPLNRWAER